MAGLSWTAPRLSLATLAVLLFCHCQLALSAAVSSVGREKALLGKRTQFKCSVKSPDNAAELEIWWQFRGRNVSNSDRIQVTVSKTPDGNVSSEMLFSAVAWSDAGLYSCVAKEVSGAGSEYEPSRQDIHLEVFGDPQATERTNGKGKVGQTSEMSCTFVSRPLTKVVWLRNGVQVEEDPKKYEISTEKKADNEIKAYLKILDLQHSDNLTFLCHGTNEHGSDTAMVYNLVLDKPQVELDLIKAVGQSKIYLNWTITEWNSPVTNFFLSYRASQDSAWVYYVKEKIPSDAISFVMDGLKPNEQYLIKLAAKNSQGLGSFDEYHETVTTLETEPVFVPTASLKGLTWNSVSIGWTTPKEDNPATEFIEYYKLTRRKSGEPDMNMYQPADKYSFFLWRHLEPASEYTFTVAACNGYTRECGSPSEAVSAATEDGKSGPPSQVEMLCKFDNVSGMNYVEVKWGEPEQSNGEIELFNVSLEGAATYLDADAKLNVDTVGPESKTEAPSSRRARFDFLQPNTNYSATVCATTRSQECGASAKASCAMPPTQPPPDQLARTSWTPAERSGHPVFSMLLPKLSQRRGQVCCVRVVMVKLPEDGTSPPVQEDLALASYRDVHSGSGAWGGYIAEILGPNFLGKRVVVGDGQNILAANLGGEECPQCQTGVRAHLLRAAARAENVARGQRSVTFSPSSGPNFLVEDGFLDPDSNYSAFIEVVIAGGIIGRSPYFAAQKPGESPLSLDSVRMQALLVSILGILAGLVFVALSLLIALVLLKRYSKKVAATQGGVEMNLHRSLRHLYSTLRGRDHSQYLITPEAPKAEVGPITKNELVQAYMDRHKDSDYGFQAEFELLPDRYPDRTTEECDRPCNRAKNRYPDIKCYDQTRVKLEPIEDKEGSDYINANFVSGYKDRKKWICAQGPLEHTVADFWRMVYEQDVRLLIMLTNLEEYNRVKCAQYWPGAGDHNYCTQPMIINVAFCTERRFSDYTVRELKLTMMRGEERVERTVYHYHYLQWKDFNAPEHAPGMLRFVKRVNEAWKQQGNGSTPILVHCSAGVGRSGTLIAIDSLMQQLEEEKEVKIYQLVCGLRHHRNYLVQSVKQYVFVYRAIMEMGQFGDTEIEAKEMKALWLKLSSSPGNPTLQKEFDKLSDIVDDRKAFSVASNEENKIKNQSDAVIPFDRNRVILTPDGQRPHSTYINASFIEGYHNDESFIITQDPLPSTAEDFWRMVLEHNISTMVMLSADRAWNYWEDEKDNGTATFGAIKVTRASRENLPHYVKREFDVYNPRTEEELRMTHFAYSAWTGSESSDVPSTSTGLLDLVEHASAYKAEAGLPGPITVHCRCGSDRSSVFVALTCLAQQIKNEARADIFTVVRKLRSQRQGMVQHINQYRFIYSAISDYVDLYRSKDEEYAYSVPVNSIPSANGTVVSSKSSSSNGGSTLRSNKS